MQIARLYPVVAMLVVEVAFSACEAHSSAAATPFVANALPTLHATRVSVYVTQANGASDGVVYGYTANNKANRLPVCTITGQKFDHSQIAVDASGNTYLPNLETGAIEVYGPNCGALLASVLDPFGADVDVALGSNGTFFGVARSSVSICTMSGCASELTDPSIFQLETAAVDASGNVWATFYNQKGAPSLIVWPKALMPGKLVSGYVNSSTPGDLSFDRRGNMLSLQTLFPHVFVYRCNLTTTTCTNTKTVTLRAGALFGALNASNSDFQVSDYPNNKVDVYSYPAFTFEYSYNRGFKQNYSVQGIAQMP
jgi:hypothetical protein